MRKRSYERYLNEVLQAINEAERTGKPVATPYQKLYRMMKEIEKEMESKKQ